MRQHEATKKKIEGCSRQVNGFHMFPGIFFFAALPPPNCLLATHAGHLANCSQEKNRCCCSKTGLVHIQMTKNIIQSVDWRCFTSNFRRPLQVQFQKIEPAITKPWLACLFALQNPKSYPEDHSYDTTSATASCEDLVPNHCSVVETIININKPSPKSP